MLYIGVDLGTSSVKMLLMEGNGTIQKVVNREYDLHFPNPGWSEQHPRDCHSGVVRRNEVGHSVGHALAIHGACAGCYFQ